MNPLETAEIGKTGLRVTRLGLGGAPFGDLPPEIARYRATESIKKGLELGIGYFDTAPLYGSGKSEVYHSLALADVNRSDYVISTKVGKLLVPSTSPDNLGDKYVSLPPLDVVFDYSRDAILKSIDESLERLKLNHVDILFIHGPDDYHDQAVNEAFPVLAELRSQGVIKAIGVGMNYWEPLADFALECDFDCFLMAGRYSLLDQSGLIKLLPLCEEKDISIILGGPYNSGILASDLSTETSTYFYKNTPPNILEKAKQIKAICDSHKVPLKAAAIQFSLSHPAIASTIPGARSASEIDENFRMLEFPIPTDLWSELKYENFIPQHAPIT